MLLEIIQARPPLIRTWAVLAKAEIHHLGSTLRFFVVHTFLMTSQVVDRAEPLSARTIGLVTFEELSMACLMFSMITVSH